MTDDSGHPTILVVYETREFREVLIRNLQQGGYLVLIAQNLVEASEIVIRHSRRIHLLLADDSEDGRTMASTLKPYRSDMRVIHMGSNPELGSVLMEVSRVFDPLPKQKKKREK